MTLADTIVDETDYSFAQLYQRHAGALAGLDRFEESESYYLRALAICIASLGEEDRRTRQVIELVATMYEAWGRPKRLRRITTKPRTPEPDPNLRKDNDG